MRADLLALTPDALAALTNRGLVKRATREVAAAPPAVTEDADGTVRGVYPDGPETALPPGGLDRGGCTCGATGICRHVVGLVLAYRTGPDDAEDPAPPQVVRWSPGRFTDEQLEARIGARQLTAARRAHKGGYVARVHRPGVADPAPRVELGSATVRFLVPDDLGFVHTDAVAGARDDVLALAVWAFRVADAVAPDADDVQVDVGGPETAGADGGDGSLEAALRLAGEVLLTGATQVGPGLAGAVAEVRQRLDRAGLRWPLLAVGDLEEQLGAYQQRAGSYSHERLAGLLAELYARHRAVTNRGTSLRARVLGTQEAAETPMRRARLDGLGCRVRAAPNATATDTTKAAITRATKANATKANATNATNASASASASASKANANANANAAEDTGRQVEIYFAHADSATVLVLRRTFTDSPDTATGIGSRRVGGATVAQLAGGNVVTESAIRSASRTVRLATSRIAKTTVTPSQGLWTSLPEALVVRDLRALAAELDRLPPRVVRPRVEAELVRVVQIAEVRSMRYTPGAQRLDAIVADPAGGLATITATHTAAAPGALDAIAAALSGPVRAVAGIVGRTRGELFIEPLGLAVGDDGVVLPDLAPAGGFRVDGTGIPAGGDPLRHAVDRAVALLAEVPHRGLRMLPPTFGDRLRDAADSLARVGLHRCAAALAALRAGLGPDPDAVAAELWVDAYLRLLVTLELQ